MAFRQGGAFGFTWIVIGKQNYLSCLSNYNPSESSLTDQKRTSSPEGHLTCLDQT